MRLRILLISFILSLPFWWLMNILAGKLEDLWFFREMIKNPQILTAQMDSHYQIIKIKKERENLKSLQVLADNLESATKVAISVEIDRRGEERILYEKNSHNSLPIASLTKLMTALVVSEFDETYDPSSVLLITQEAVEQEGKSKYGELKEGEFLSIESLTHIMLIESSNDAAYAVAGLIGQEGFAELMNLYAKDIGLGNSHFVNSTGLEPDDPERPKNTSTARDLVKLTRYILEKYPQIFEITTIKSYEVLNPDGSLHHFIPENTNELLGEIEGIIGGKTGWSPAAGGCLLLVLEKPRKDGYIINVILGAQDRFEEMRKLIKLTSQ